MTDIPLIFEFRNQAWLKEGTFQFWRGMELDFALWTNPNCLS